MKDLEAINDKNELIEWSQELGVGIKTKKGVRMLNMFLDTNPIGFITLGNYSDGTVIGSVSVNNKVYKLYNDIPIGWKICGYIPIKSNKGYVAVLKRKANLLYWGIVCIVSSKVLATFFLG